ncbi:MAG: thiamine pyrophosphate-dependent enzyme [Verrucomicrobiota bacterium]|nr:thiamine pyrophosphate-dependent enzyme [Verrucomicrobiota bacterium]
MRALTNEDKLKLLTILLESRHGDLREQNLNRQGKGHFHVSGMGHEALAAISFQMEADDYIFPYYRDRGLVLGRGVASRELALDYMAKRKGQSGGRQMPSHYSYADRNIWSVPTPTGANLLPACGAAWGMKLDGKRNFAVATIGDAATRQGDFYEAICFAKERRLAVMFVVEDNAYGISSPTRKINPLALGVLAPNEWREVDGTNVQITYEAAAQAIEELRDGQGPILLWVKMERLSSHTSSDDHKLYRSAEDLAKLEEGDPLKRWKEQLIAEAVITADDYAKLDSEIKERVRQEFLDADKAPDPTADELETQVTGSLPGLTDEVLPAGKYRIGDTVNKTLRAGLAGDPHRLIFGEDVEDPKGGVFRLTQKLSTEFPDQVFNSPLAESTILGVACGLASYGKRPVFELQFIDFIGPAWNQIVTNLSTLRWRSFGTWTCPLVIYAPYGAYLPGGSLWHSQANEAPLAHYPGINIAIPSTPEDAAGLLWSAMHAEDPTFVLIPKHLLWAEHESAEPIRAVPLGRARKRNSGSDVTVVAWGNTVEKSLEAVEKIGGEISIDLIDLRSIVPWDRDAIEESVRRTGRLVVVQEDTENCSVGQMIITHLTGLPEIWNELVSPPILVSKPNVLIGYNPIYEYAALPDVERIIEAIRRAVSMRGERVPVASAQQRAGAAIEKAEAAQVRAKSTSQRAQSITVPIMGEGIRTAKVVALLKKPGDSVEFDDPLCEVETDKAVYPIESSFAGTMGEWKTEIGATVDIGQEIGTVLSSETNWEDQLESVAEVSPDSKQNGAHPTTPAASLNRTESAVTESNAPKPALSPTITRRLGRVVPANLQIDARWGAVCRARTAAKNADGDAAASPSVMIAWCVVRAMEKHAGFRRVMLEDDSIVQHDDFDLGVAVSLDDDRLATAVLTHANKLAWPDFVTRYNQTVDETRGGRVDAVNAPIVISSLGAFGVRAAAPIVVPPSVGTLFVGSAHFDVLDDGKNPTPTEVITLSLTFDHRVVNGAGAANFVREIATEIERFEIPSDAVAKK